MLAVSPQVASPPPPLHHNGGSARSLADMPIRRLFADDDDGDDDDDDVPSVAELLQHVRQLQAAALQLEPRGASDDDDDAASLDELSMPLDASMRGRISSNSVHAQLRRRQSSFASDLLNTSFSSDSGAPPRPTASGRTPAPRVAALTKENISLLRAPLDHRRSANFAGSVCGSQKSRTSVRTDGGAVFSRLYQPDFYKMRDAKLKAIRDRQESFNLSLIPRANNRTSVCSRDSAASSSVGSMMSAKTDVMNVSSRLYDPDYMRKRTAKLQKMREERELRACTFAPTINSGASNASSYRRSSNVGLGTPKK